MLDPVVSHLLALGGALLFGTAAWGKLRSFAGFRATLTDYRVVPERFTGAVSVTICCVELAVSAGLPWPGTRAPAAVLGTTLLLVYAAAIAVNLLRGRRDVDCGCGRQPTVIAGWLVIRNMMLAALLTVLQMPVSSRVLGLADYATIAGALIGTVLLFLSAEALLARPTARQLRTMESP